MPAAGGVLETIIHGPSYFGSYSVVYSIVLCIEVLKMNIKVWWCTLFVLSLYFNSSSWEVKAARSLFEFEASLVYTANKW